eukprot:s1487_g7.t1
MLEFSAGVASVQVCNITVQGSLRLGLQPLLESLNPVGGVSVTCLERPMIDLTIKTGTELIPNLYNFVQDTVDDVIADLIVVPNMVAVPIDDSVDGCSLRHPLPLGFLRLSLEGITAAGPLPSSVHVEVELGVQRWQSGLAKVSSYSRQAEWLEGNVKELAVYSQDQLLRFRVFSHGFTDRVTGPSLLSSGQVFVRDLMPGHVEVPMTDAERKQGWVVAENSSVELFLSWMPVSEQPASAVDEERPACHGAFASRGGSQRWSASHAGYAGRLLLLAKKLCGKLALVDLADALNIPVEHAREFALEHERRRKAGTQKSTASASWDQQWCTVARQAAHQQAAGREPHFDQVCHLRAGKGDALLIELLGICEGPFHLPTADDAHCTLHGRVQLRRIETPPKRSDAHLLAQVVIASVLPQLFASAVMSVKKSLQDLGGNTLAAAIAGCCQPAIFNPMDCLRIRWQVSRGTETHFMSFAQQLLRSEGLWRALWRPGLPVNMCAVAVSQGLRMGLYPTARDTLQLLAPSKNSKSGASMLGAGLAAGSVAYFIGAPFWLVKTRLQAAQQFIAEGRKTPALAFAEVYPDARSDQKRFRCSPLIARGALLTAGQMLGYDGTKTIARECGFADAPAVHVTAATVAGFSAASLSAPADTVLTQYQSRGGLSLLRCAEQMWQERGVAAFFRGWTANFLRLAPTFTERSVEAKAGSRDLGGHGGSARSTLSRPKVSYWRPVHRLLSLLGRRQGS